MPRPARQHAAPPSHDSFLDIVANMVGILIILVMVVGLRAKNTPVMAVSGGQAGLAAELEDERARQRALSAELLAAEQQTRSLRQEALRQCQTCDALADSATAAQQQLRTRQEQMDAETQRLFQLQSGLSESQRELERLQQRRVQVTETRPEPILIQSYPTPLSRTVTGHETHFQLSGGQIVRIRLEELIDEFKRSVERQKYKLLSQPELTDTVGPLDGFRLRYAVVRRDISAETAVLTGQTGSYAELEHWMLIPASSRLGEPLDLALAADSQFRQAIAELRPGRDTITIWTYEDSFASFGRLKQELYQLGFSVAARPLPLGVPIAGSPQGSRSAAE